MPFCVSTPLGFQAAKINRFLPELLTVVGIAGDTSCSQMIVQSRISALLCSDHTLSSWCCHGNHPLVMRCCHGNHSMVMSSCHGNHPLAVNSCHGVHNLVPGHYHGVQGGDGTVHQRSGVTDRVTAVYLYHHIIHHGSTPEEIRLICTAATAP